MMNNFCLFFIIVILSFTFVSSINAQDYQLESLSVSDTLMIIPLEKRTETLNHMVYKNETEVEKKVRIILEVYENVDITIRIKKTILHDGVVHSPTVGRPFIYEGTIKSGEWIWLQESSQAVFMRPIGKLVIHFLD